VSVSYDSVAKASVVKLLCVVVLFSVLECCNLTITLIAETKY